MPLISIKAEPIAEIGGFPITNSFLTSIIVVLLFLILSVYFYSQTQKTFSKRSWLFFFIYYMNKAIYNFLSTILKKDVLSVTFPFLSALFFFILLQNWFGLLPGIGSIILRSAEKTVPLFRGSNSDLNGTLALGITAFIMIQFYGITFLGAKKYLSKFINFKNPINFFVGILDIISELSRILSFSFRLFGNIFAGEVILIVLAFLVPVLVSFPFLIMEIFFGFIQALIFLLLTSLFISTAIVESH